MDNLQWFKFSISNWVIGRIQKCPEVTQARFVRLICLYWSKECLLSIEDAEIEIDKEHLDILISKKVVKINDEFIAIDFLNEQFEDVLNTSKKRREAVQKRWSKVKQIDTSVSKKNTSVLQNDTDKSKSTEEIKKDNNSNLTVDWKILLKSFNDLTGKKAKVVNEKTKRQINARLKEGYSKQDLWNAIVNCFNDPYHKENPKYLTLEFISRSDKFEKYHAEVQKSKPKQNLQI